MFLIWLLMVHVGSQPPAASPSVDCVPPADARIRFPFAPDVCFSLSVPIEGWLDSDRSYLLSTVLEGGPGANVTVHHQPRLCQILIEVDRAARLPLLGVNIGASTAVPDADPSLDAFTGLRMHGIWIDVSWAPALLTIIQQESLDIRLVTSSVTPVNVLDLIWPPSLYPERTELGLLKIDIDSYDCDVLEAVLGHQPRPRVLITEYTALFPPPIAFRLVYTPHFDWKRFHSAFDGPTTMRQHRRRAWGCSLAYQAGLLYRAGYVLVAVHFWDATWVLASSRGKLRDLAPNCDTAALQSVYLEAMFLRHPEFHRQLSAKGDLNGAYYREFTEPLLRMIAERRVADELVGYARRHLSTWPSMGGALVQYELYALGTPPVR